MNTKEIEKIKERIIKSFEGKEKYFVVSRDTDGIYITQFEAEDRDKANEIFEEEMQTNFSTDWLLDEDDFDEFVKEIKSFKKT